MYVCTCTTVLLVWMRNNADHVHVCYGCGISVVFADKLYIH